MLLSKHLIVPALTVFQWSLTTAYATLTPRNPAEIVVHSRDFRVIKRQIRNADYAGAPPPTTETTSEPAQPSKPTTSIVREAHPTAMPQGSSKDSRGIGFHARYNHELKSATPLSDLRSSDGLAPAPAKLEKYKTASKNSRACKTTVVNGTYARRSPRNLVAQSQEEPKSHTSKSRTRRDNSKVIARAPQEAPTESSTAENAPTSVPSPDSKQFHRLQDSDPRPKKMHDLPAHDTTGFLEEKRKESDSDVQLDSTGL